MSTIMNKKITLIIIWFIILIAIILNIYSKNNYNYFQDNKESLELIKNYIKQKELSWRINLSNNLIQFNSWSIYKKCILNKKCSLWEKQLIKILKNLKINNIVAYSEYVWLLKDNWIDTDIIWISFYLNDWLKLSWSKDNFIYYSHWFYKWKIIKQSFNWNKFHRIIKIFNDDWWIINGCYWCGGWGWD